MTTTQQAKSGLVLSGGGAKGAYQAGVIRYLAEAGIQIDAISSASIGGLNAAMIASSPNLAEASRRLNDTWIEIARHHKPLQIDKRMARLGGAVLIASALVCVYMPYLRPAVAATTARLLEDASIFSDTHVSSLIQKYIDIDAVRSNIPFWVSMYESDGLFVDLHNIFGGMLGKETKPSVFRRIDSLPDNDAPPTDRETALKCLLASAAIPLLFPRQEIDGKKYVDGGIGGWRNSSGNTPIEPLIEHGCSSIIVSHLSDGSLWDRHDYPGATIVEIRPRGIERVNGPVDLLAFDEKSVRSWIEQGYRDTKESIAPIIDALQVHRAVQNQKDLADSALTRLLSDDFRIE